MRIYTKTSWTWDGVKYLLDSAEFFEYNGPLELSCGATGAQSQIQSSQINFMNQLQSQAGAVFGDASQVFSSLMSTFAPIVAAGPNQQGFSPALLSNLNSQAITQTGQAYKNAAAAVGNAQSAINGGNTSLPSGANIATEDALASSAANQTANELMGVTQENYAVGRQNYENAVQGELAAPNVFGSATNAANAATNAGNAASNTANQVAQENNSWISAVTGLAGAVGGAALGGLTAGALGSPAGGPRPTADTAGMSYGNSVGGITPISPGNGADTVSFAPTGSFNQQGAYGMWNTGQ